MEKFRNIIISAVALTALAGCIRDEYEPCPPLAIEVTVQDKNWSNIDEAVAEGLAAAVSEDLPFRDYVQSLTYELRDLSTGEIVSSAASYSVSHDGLSEILTFPESLPFGTYEINLWGNLDPSSKSEGVSVPDNGTVSVTLHEDGDGEADQIYHVCDTVYYNYDAASFTAGLQRTVGCLLVDAVNLPGGIDWSEKDIDGVLGTVSRGLEYSDPVSVHTELDWGGDASAKRSMTCVGPSASENGTSLQVTFRDTDSAEAGDDATGIALMTDGFTGNAASGIVTDPVSLTLRRNELTMVRYDYDGQGFKISIYVDGNWEIVHDMEVD